METNVILLAASPYHTTSRAVCVGNYLVSKCNKSEKEVKTRAINWWSKHVNFESVSTRRLD